MENAGLIEMLFSFGVIVALILWDLYNTPRPDRDKTGKDADEGKEKAASDPTE